MQVTIEALAGVGPDEQPVEVVERKGVGHPDTICDALAEELSLSLSRYYRDRFGAILHHNVDKALLWGGRSRAAFGGGEVLAPIEIYLAGRATLAWKGVCVPLEEIAVDGSRRWLAAHLRHLDAREHVKLHTLVRPGSTELVELFLRLGPGAPPPANDTSCGVGWAPLSRLEATVAHVEHVLNAASTKANHPEIGEDVKVMGVRRGPEIELTVACAFVDRHVMNVDDYVEKRATVTQLARDAARSVAGTDARVTVNAADEPARGSLYLTVTGTSAEAGDDGQPGRGNRANGLIAPGRPMTLESTAGKNPVSHVGKLYNLTAGLIAQALVDEIPGVCEAHCWLVSRIGSPITEPQIVHLRLRDAGGRPTLEHLARAEAIARDQLARMTSLAADLLDGRIALDRWPFRV